MNDKRAVVNYILLFFASTIHFSLCQEVFFKLPDSLKHANMKAPEDLEVGTILFQKALLF